MTREEISTIGNRHYADMKAMGWIDPSQSNEHCAMLAICEVCEAIQAHRRGSVFTKRPISAEILSSTIDDPYYPDELFREDFEFYCKDTTADEMADTLLRLLSLYWMRGYDQGLLLTDEIEILPDIFTEQAMEFTWRLTNHLTGVRECHVRNSIAYVVAWAEMFGIELKTACIRKMRYNRIRSDWKNGEKKY